MFFVRCHVDAVWAVWNRHITGVFLVLPFAAIQNFYTVEFNEITSGNARFDLFDVKDHNVVTLGFHHLWQGHAHFRVIRGREGVFAVIIGVGVIKVS